MQFTGTDLFLGLAGVFVLLLVITDARRNVGRRVGGLVGATLVVATGIMLLVNAAAHPLVATTSVMQKAAIVVVSTAVACGVVLLLRKGASAREP